MESLCLDLHTIRCLESVSVNINEINKKTMTLRDQFASAALTGILSNSSIFFDDNDKIAKVSYEIADAMIEARKKSNEIKKE